MLESTQRLYTRMRTAIEAQYGEMYYRLMLMLSQMSLTLPLHPMIVDILEIIRSEESEPKAAERISQRLGSHEQTSAQLLQRACGLAKLVKPHLKSSRVLDFGCGDGEVSVQLNKLGGAFRTLYDISDYRTKQARSMFPDFRTEWFEIEQRQPFSDAIVLTVLHHCDQPMEVLERVMSVAKHLVIVESVLSRLNTWELQALIDWFENRCLHPGVPIPVPGAFLSDEAWQAEFAKRGWTLTHHQDLGVDMPFAPEHHVLYVIDKQ